MGGRGTTSASANARRHERYLAGELGTKVTKNDEFLMKMVFPGMNYHKIRQSKSSVYIHADRISKSGENISVMVPAERVRETPYGYALVLDAGHVQYLKSWQVSAQTVPHKGVVGVNVSMSHKYFNPKRSKFVNNDYASDAKQIAWDEWKKTAKAQQRAGNIVSIRQ